MTTFAERPRTESTMSLNGRQLQERESPLLPGGVQEHSTTTKYLKVRRNHNSYHIFLLCVALL